MMKEKLEKKETDRGDFKVHKEKWLKSKNVVDMLKNFIKMKKILKDNYFYMRKSKVRI